MLFLRFSLRCSMMVFFQILERSYLSRNSFGTSQHKKGWNREKKCIDNEDQRLILFFLRHCLSNHWKMFCYLRFLFTFMINLPFGRSYCMHCLRRNTKLWLCLIDKFNENSCESLLKRLYFLKPRQNSLKYAFFHILRLFSIFFIHSILFHIFFNFQFEGNIYL